MRLTYQSAAVAVAFAMTASAATSDLPNLSTATIVGVTTGTTTAKTASNAGTTTSISNTATSTAAGATITGSGSTGATGVVPTITGGTTATDGALTGLPTLSGAVQAFTVSVPNLSNAPFMQTSTLPDGTVFIVVGAILGFMALSVLLWRALVAWSLHRSVKRAASHQLMDDKKALFATPAPPAPFYKYSDRDSTISLSGLGPKSKKSERPRTGGAGTNAASLFFSPTAGAAGGATGSRGSTYLPAGYYAAGASAPGNGSGHVSIGGHRQDISLSTLRPDSQGYGRARSMMGPSPPDSPAISAERGHMASSSTLNLNQGYGGNERAPSAYLEDLIDGDNTVPPGHSRLRDHSNSPASTRY